MHTRVLHSVMCTLGCLYTVSACRTSARFRIRYWMCLHYSYLFTPSTYKLKIRPAVFVLNFFEQPIHLPNAVCVRLGPFTLIKRIGSVAGCQWRTKQEVVTESVNLATPCAGANENAKLYNRCGVMAGCKNAPAQCKGSLGYIVG